MFGLFVIAMMFPAISFQASIRAGVIVTPTNITGAESSGGQAVADDLSLMDAKLTDCLAKLTGVSSVAGNKASDIKARIAWLQDRLSLLMSQSQSLEPANKSARQNRNLPRLLKEAARWRSEVAFIEKLVGQKDNAAPRVKAQSPIKLAPQGTGAISGTVTDAQTLLPISGINVVIFDADNNIIELPATDGSGNYMTPATLETGTYYALTSNGLGYLDKLYNNISCTGGNCLPNAGTPITVTSGATTSGINFALTLGSKISGNIKDATTMANLQNVTVTVYDPEGNTVATAVSNAAGNYTTNQGFAAGTYYARTTNNTTGYINQIYNGAPCVVCTLGSGTPISVPAATTVTGINFALTAGGRISGTVTNAATSTPLSGVQVQILHASGLSLATATTNASGVYTCPVGLTTGSYYVRTNSATGFINEIYNDISCQACSPGLGTPVAVTTGVTTTGINFALTAGGRISGTVIDATTSTPLPGVNVSIYNSGGVVFTTVGTDGSGNFLTRPGLPTGTYYVKTSSEQVDQVYNSISCQGCDPIKGTPISVTTGATTSGINFSLGTGGRISGKVINAANSAPLGGVEVDIFTPCQGFVTAAITDGLGNYTTSDSFPTGTYYAVTFNDQGFIEKVYDNSPTCLLCDPTLGTPISVTSGATTSAINFALNPGGRISGVTTDATGTVPLLTSPFIYDANGAQVSTGSITAFGTFKITSGLSPGTYYVRSNNSAGYVNELYNNISCVGGCDTTVGAPVIVTAGTTVSGINFALDPGGRIAGTVTNAATSAPLAGVFLNIFNASGVAVATATTDTYGNYLVLRGLPTGTYYATTLNLQGYVNKAYNNVTCVGCNPTSTTPITVTNGAITTGINFALNTGGGRISGLVTNAATSAPFPNVIVNFYTSSGAFATNTKTDCSGNFTCDDGLTTGSYYVRTANTQGFVDQLYNNITCINCDPTTGTLVPVTIGANTPGINLSLCHMALSSASAYFSTVGNEGSFNLLTSAGCSWTATSNNSWIEVTSAPSGTGGTAINYTVRDNFSLIPRVGTITVAGLTFTITQDSESAPDCTYTISPAFAAYSASGGTGSVSVVAEERCAWQSSSNVSWITITSNCCSIGNGAVSYTVAPNPGSAARAGVITVAEKTFSVKQKGH